MIGDDGVEQFEILLDRSYRHFLGWMIYTHHLKNRTDAMRLCLDMAARWFQENGNYPGLTERPDTQIISDPPAS